MSYKKDDLFEMGNYTWRRQRMARIALYTCAAMDRKPLPYVKGHLPEAFVAATLEKMGAEWVEMMERFL